MGDFSDRVFEVVRRIPRGKVATYGQVGRLIGAPRSARYVGYALRANPEPGAEVNSIPCHRVVFKDGGLCKGFAFGGPEVQREMLEAEGVAFADDAHVDMGACLWDGRMDYFGPDALVDLVLERPENVELVVTGRGASDTLTAVADLVTEMREVKHYYEEGVLARRGIEF